jgi:hypothetical protein
MKLSPCSGGKPQNVEDGIVGGSLRLATDPVLHTGQSQGSLVNIVALGDIGDRLKQLSEAFVPIGSGFALPRASSTPWGANCGARSAGVFHPTTFLSGAFRH